MRENYTKSAQEAIRLAKSASRHNKQNYTGTEHLLLGLIAEPDGVASKVLRDNNCTLERLNDMISQLNIKSANLALLDHEGFSPRCQKIMRIAGNLAERFHSDQVGTEHLLLAIITEGEDFVRVQANKRLQPTKIRTEKYPGFPTDMQSQMTACLAIANGNSKVKETVWENRFEYTEELKKMGADIQVRDREALIVGQEKLHGARVRATDLRAGAALVIAGLAAHGITYVEEIKYIQRGYEDFEGKIKALGGKILMTEFIGDVDIEATIKVHS